MELRQRPSGVSRPAVVSLLNRKKERRNVNIINGISNQQKRRTTQVISRGRVKGKREGNKREVVGDWNKRMESDRISIRRKGRGRPRRPEVGKGVYGSQQNSKREGQVTIREQEWGRTKQWVDEQRERLLGTRWGLESMATELVTPQRLLQKFPAKLHSQKISNGSPMNGNRRWGKLSCVKRDVGQFWRSITKGKESANLHCAVKGLIPFSGTKQPNSKRSNQLKMLTNNAHRSSFPSTGLSPSRKKTRGEEGVGEVNLQAYVTPTKNLTASTAAGTLEKTTMEGTGKDGDVVMADVDEKAQEEEEKEVAEGGGGGDESNEEKKVEQEFEGGLAGGKKGGEDEKTDEEGSEEEGGEVAGGKAGGANGGKGTEKVEGLEEEVEEGEQDGGEEEKGNGLKGQEKGVKSPLYGKIMSSSKNGKEGKTNKSKAKKGKLHQTVINRKGRIEKERKFENYTIFEVTVDVKPGQKSLWVAQGAMKVVAKSLEDVMEGDAAVVSIETGSNKTISEEVFKQENGGYLLLGFITGSNVSGVPVNKLLQPRARGVGKFTFNIKVGSDAKADTDVKWNQLMIKLDSEGVTFVRKQFQYADTKKDVAVVHFPSTAPVSDINKVLEDAVNIAWDLMQEEKLQGGGKKVGFREERKEVHVTNGFGPGLWGKFEGKDEHKRVGLVEYPSEIAEVFQNPEAVRAMKLCMRKHYRTIAVCQIPNRFDENVSGIELQRWEDTVAKHVYMNESMKTLVFGGVLVGGLDKKIVVQFNGSTEVGFSRHLSIRDMLMEVTLPIEREGVKREVFMALFEDNGKLVGVVPKAAEYLEYATSIRRSLCGYIMFMLFMKFGATDENIFSFLRKTFNKKAREIAQKHCYWDKENKTVLVTWEEEEEQEGVVDKVILEMDWMKEAKEDERLVAEAKKKPPLFSQEDFVDTASMGDETYAREMFGKDDGYSVESKGFSMAELREELRRKNEDISDEDSSEDEDSTTQAPQARDSDSKLGPSAKDSVVGPGA